MTGELKTIENWFMETVPRLKKAELIEKITLSVDEPFKTEWVDAKCRGIDVAEWARRILKREMPKLKADQSA